MQKNSNRKGLALGAIFALVASAFAGVAPAQAAPVAGANIGIYPAVGTTFGGTVLEDFPIYAQVLPGSANNNFGSDLMWKVDVTSGTNMDVAISASAAAVDMTATASYDLSATSMSAVILASDAVKSATASGSSKNYLNFRVSSASGVASWSSVTLTITTWIDEINPSGDALDADEWRTVQTVTLYAPSAIPATATLAGLSAGDTKVTVSSTVGVNTSNLTGRFFWVVTSSAAVFDSSSPSTGGTDTTNSSSPVGGTAITALGNVVSLSFVARAFSASQTVSASLRYVPTATAVAGPGVGYLVSPIAAGTVGAVAATALSISSVANANVTGGGTAYSIRPNQTYTIRVHALSVSTSVSDAAVTVRLTGADLATGSKEISINGGALRGTYPATFTATTGADGYATFTVRTSGFGLTDALTVNANIGNNVNATAVNYTGAAATYTVAADFANYLTAPGTAVAIPFSVDDQWELASARTDQYLKVTRGGDGFAYATTVSYVPVTAGVANVSFTPEAATKTGSATVGVSIVRLINGAWDADGSSTATVTVTVTTSANAFAAGLAASRSASVSYFPSTVSWTAISGNVDNAGSAINVSGSTDLIFRVSSTVDATTSGALTLRAGAAGAYSFEVASLKQGDFTITLTNGTATTTSLLVVDAVADDSGRSVTFDTTNLEAGKTRVITGTVLDANGNGVDTTGGDATILVTFAGSAGIPVGTMPVETNADGEFQISVFTGASDTGSFTLTATYLKDGPTTATAARITTVQVVTVGAAVAAPASDQKLTVGSFKGFVAIYTLNYTGQKLSAKVAGKWLVVNELSKFQRVVRNTGAGFTIKVDLYIDGAFVRSETVVTK